MYVFMDIIRWVDEGKEACLSPNDVICIFEKLPRDYILNAIDKTTSWDYKNGEYASDEMMQNIHTGNYIRILPNLIQNSHQIHS